MDQKKAYEEKLRAQLDGWNAEIDKLEAKFRERKADANIDYSTKIEELKRKREEMRNKLDQLQRSGEDAWQDIKAGVEGARSALSDALQSAKERFDKSE